MSGARAICDFCKKKLLNQKMQIFLGEKAFFFKAEMDFPTFKTQNII